jgi:hypothetical protein
MRVVRGRRGTYGLGGIFREAQTEEASLGDGEIVVWLLQGPRGRRSQFKVHWEVCGRGRQASSPGAEVDKLGELSGGHHEQRLPEINDVSEEEQGQGRGGEGRGSYSSVGETPSYSVTFWSNGMSTSGSPQKRISNSDGVKIENNSVGSTFDIPLCSR